MEQVLLNLTLHARDAMPTGGTFTIRTRNVAMPPRLASTATEDELPPGRYALLRVSDTGLGMDAATKARVFEPFFTTKPVGQGTGLGLATAFGIVRQSGGTIRVYSAPGEGTTFNIYLPEVSDPLEAPEPPSAPHIESGSGTVLVVEDDPIVREVTCRTLQAQGYRCLETDSGEEALDLVRQGGEEIEVVVTDVVMPHMSGRELAEKIAELRPTIPVLFMSAYPSDDVIRRGLLAPGAQLVQKPFAPEVLAAKLRELLSSRAPSTAPRRELGTTK
jgi:two-component system cell cycle sensor histidine kinase/response regulator CckA